MSSNIMYINFITRTNSHLQHRTNDHCQLLYLKWFCLSVKSFKFQFKDLKLKKYFWCINRTRILSNHMIDANFYWDCCVSVS